MSPNLGLEVQSVMSATDTLEDRMVESPRKPLPYLPPQHGSLLLTSCSAAQVEAAETVPQGRCGGGRFYGCRIQHSNASRESQPDSVQQLKIKHKTVSVLYRVKKLNYFKRVPGKAPKILKINNNHVP